MNKFLLVLLCVLSLNAFAQEEVKTESKSSLNEAFIPESRMAQYNDWLEGKEAFPPKYKHQWALGVSGGMMRVTGDVKSEMGQGWGLELRKALGYSFSMRLNYVGGKAYGLNWSPSAAYAQNSALNGTNGPDYSTQKVVYHNYKTNLHMLSVEGLFNFNNVLFHQRNNTVSPYIFAGLGALAYATKVDQLDENGVEYRYDQIANRSNDIKFKDSQKNSLQGMLDGEYETDGQLPGSAVKLNDNMPIRIQATLGAGIDFRLTDRFSIGFEHKIGLQNDDLLDAQQWQEPTSEVGLSNVTAAPDVLHYTSLRFTMNLGKNAEKPEWWVNPLALTYDNMQELNRKTDYDADEDNDGVHDAYDLEPGSEAGAVVDPRGRTLDSDKDGFPDHTDPEPFSTPQFEIDARGVNVYPYITEEDALELIRKNATGKWFLPSIFFDLAKYVIRAEDAERFDQVAYVMNANSNLKVEAIGYADTRGSEESNLKLSQNRVEAAINYITEKYGIDRSRFVIKYKGETDLLLPNAQREVEHQMNRRVQFRVVD